MAEMVVDFLVRLLPQECLICMDRVSRQQSSLRFWNIFLDVFKKVPGSLIWSCFRFKDFCYKTILSMRPRTPLVLRFHRQLSFNRNEIHTILSIVSFDWWITAPHPFSSTTSKLPLVIMQNISIITSLSTSRPVICAGQLSSAI
jgi:hypothetical protein